MYTTMHTSPIQSACQLTFKTAHGSYMTHLKAMHLTFYGLIKWHGTHVKYDRPWAWNIPKHTFSNICFKLHYHSLSPITVPYLLFKYSRTTWKNCWSYNGSLHTMSHLIFILYILFLSFYINCLFQLHTFCTLGWQSVTINGTKI